MPIYEYRCCGCNDVFEVFQGHRDPPPARHSCGATEVTRVLSRTSFRLVGDGWYQSDYGSRPQPPDKGEAAGGSAEAASKPAGKPGASEPSSAAGGPAAAASDAGKKQAAAKPSKTATTAAADAKAKGPDRTG